MHLLSHQIVSVLWSECAGAELGSYQLSTCFTGRQCATGFRQALPAFSALTGFRHALLSL